MGASWTASATVNISVNTGLGPKTFKPSSLLKTMKCESRTILNDGSEVEVFVNLSVAFGVEPGEGVLENSSGMTAAYLLTQATSRRSGEHVEANCAAAKSKAKKGRRLRRADFVAIFA